MMDEVQASSNAAKTSRGSPPARQPWPVCVLNGRDQPMSTGPKVAGQARYVRVQARRVRQEWTFRHFFALALLLCT